MIVMLNLFWQGFQGWNFIKEAFMCNVSLNDDTDYGQCFVCGPNNLSGLRLRFARDGDSVKTKFRGGLQHQGFPGRIHGGVITALLDEVMSRVSLLEGIWTMTARIDIRFRNPVAVNEDVTVVGCKSNNRRGIWKVRGSVILDDGSTAAEAVGTFLEVPDETLAKITENYPILSSEWMSRA
jgi:acyl-coenzyme A thioesterase PaaI-like protein